MKKSHFFVLAAAIVLCFSLLNTEIYMLVTRRLGNNFSDTSQTKMIDVKRYLPFESGSDLPKVKPSLKLEGELPTLDGAAALVPVYAAIINSVYPKGSVKYEGGKFSDDNYYGENFAPDSKMQYKNTVRGYKAIVDGDTDIFFSAAPSEEQKQYAKEKGAELKFIPIGSEAFVFFVNKNNPVDNLTTDQIRDIYGGNITNWADAGGANRPVNPVTRIKGSGSQTVMDKFMGGREYGKKTPLAVIGGSIGYSFRYYFDTMVGNSEVKMLSLNGVYPSKEHIKDGTYPLVYQFYAVYRADNKNPNVKKLTDWILSPEGQKIIEKSGYTPIK